MRKPTKETLGDLLTKSLTEVRNGVTGRPTKIRVKTLTSDASETAENAGPLSRKRRRGGC
jgi:hypothetical protein